MRHPHPNHEFFLPALRAFDFDARGFADFNCRERRFAPVKRQRSDVLPWPFNHFEHVYIRLALQRHQTLTTAAAAPRGLRSNVEAMMRHDDPALGIRSEEHTSELQSR